jgi:hypothetical protein
MDYLLDTQAFLWADAELEKVTLISCDPLVQQYPVNILW